MRPARDVLTSLVASAAVTAAIVALAVAGFPVTSASPGGVQPNGARGVATPAVSASLAWAPASTASIHPGVQLVTNGAQCTANFIYTNGPHVYIGMAAHCAGTGGNTATNGCTSPSLPLGTQVQIQGASNPGTLAYSSWLTMQGDHETDANTCQYNDLALVSIAPGDVVNVNPSVPVWGGPSGLDISGTSPGEAVYAYGDSELYGGLPAGATEGYSDGDTGSGWNTDVETAGPGVPGDSGSGFLDARGDALGVLSTLDVGVPNGVFNGVGNLAHELAYMHTHTSLTGVALIEGTEVFDPSQVPVVAGFLSAP